MSFDSLRHKLDKDKERYERLRGHFEQFRAGAMRLATDGGSPIRWIAIEDKDEALLLKFIDRRVRVSMHYVRGDGGKGVLSVEDLSAVARPAMMIDRIPFDDSGETDRPGGCTGGSLSLTQKPDQATLALVIVDVALDMDPWERAPQALPH